MGFARAESDPSPHPVRPIVDYAVDSVILRATKLIGE